MFLSLGLVIPAKNSDKSLFGNLSAHKVSILLATRFILYPTVNPNLNPGPLG